LVDEKGPGANSAPRPLNDGCNGRGITARNAPRETLSRPLRRRAH